MIGKVHNAKAVTIDNRDCWIAAIHDDRGYFSCHMEDVSEHATKEDAIAWLAETLRARGLPYTIVEND